MTHRMFTGAQLATARSIVVDVVVERWANRISILGARRSSPP